MRHTAPQKNPPPHLMRKFRPTMAASGVRPLDKEVHHYLLASYILWPLTICFGSFSNNIGFVAAVCAAFLVLGFMLYNLLVAMVQMSHLPKKRLRISQWVFWASLCLFTTRVVVVLAA